MVFYWRCQLQIFEKVTLVARWRKHFRFIFGDFFVADYPQKKKCFYTQEFTRVLSNGVVTASSHAHWRVLSNKVIWVLGHCRVNTLRIHTSEWDSLFSQAFCSPTSRSRQVTRIMSTETLLFNSFGELTRLRADDRVYDSSHSYHGVHAHPAVVVRNRWRL